MKQFLMGGAFVLSAVVLMGQTGSRTSAPTITVSSASSAIPPLRTTANWMQVDCPTGKSATGFGYQFSHGVEVVTARPTPEGTQGVTGYKFAFYNPDATSNATGAVWVICM
jgi:hypothetical protein